ncbi:MAG: hypothetical protein HKN12_02590 [Gemmatimonadetes bacterium]|nr:hypothetical protein [Gemmatimonadota bacterium]
MRALTLATMMLVTLPGAARTVQADSPAEPTPLEISVQELRDAIGTWNVTTEFLNPDGSVANTAEGVYSFEWVVPDRVVSGRTHLPEVQRTAAVLLYVSEAEEKIEMVSVGDDGKLWIMTGPLGGSTRTTQPFDTADGGTGQLRFTRYNVAPDSFESRMEFTTDEGATWAPGNHQVFRRAKATGTSP